MTSGPSAPAPFRVGPLPLYRLRSPAAGLRCWAVGSITEHGKELLFPLALLNNYVFFCRDTRTPDLCRDPAAAGLLEQRTFAGLLEHRTFAGILLLLLGYLNSEPLPGYRNTGPLPGSCCCCWATGTPDLCRDHPAAAVGLLSLLLCQRRHGRRPGPGRGKRNLAAPTNP